MLPRHYLFQILEQMEVAGRLLHDHAQPHAALRTQLLHRFHLKVFDHPDYSPDLASSDYRLKTFLEKKYFPSDDDVQIDGCHRLALLSDGKCLRHWCIGLMV
ncbi:hypothetical protein AVEN_92598-1 [Araneus ventricosus]|uniref:Histone-lysine N-methyltransferase SETMAR n=1 Tax=Araneus ventricosus TaxID=182803 RepID=A0A4Y2AI53_ARAVE|nr:hypothetical protein AVEN_92598-1 [Araneus ventricosus]